MQIVYRIIGFVILCYMQAIQAQTVELSPLYNTIGVKVTNITGIDSCKIEYKRPIGSNWFAAYPPDRVVISGIDQFRGSIFGLEANADYEIRISVYTGSSATTLPLQQANTLAWPTYNYTSNTKWVSPTGTGNYTQNSPGNVVALFNSGQVTCGTTVIFKDGLYNTNGMQLTINSDCAEGSPILLIAEPGTKPIIDASTTITSTWTAHATIANLYSTPTPSGTSHSNICVLGNTALYPYPAVTAIALLGNYNLSDLNFGYDGYVRDENTIWIKTKAGINPNDSVVKVSNSNRFLSIYGNNRKAYLKIKGLEFRYFGKPVLNSMGSSSDAYSATVFDLRNVHNVYIDSCRFLFNTNQLSFTNKCSNITVQGCYFKNDAGKWTHAMIKKSNVFLHSIVSTVSSSRARGVETPAMFLEETNKVAIGNNVFDGTNSGIESYFETGLNQDVDIYNNLFIDNFDAIECDGLWSNLRVWNNEIVRPMAGISAAPPSLGPRYFYRNVFHGMRGRRNEQDDPYFTACTPVNGNYVGQGIGIKTNSGYTGTLAPGNMYFFNNTFHAQDTLGFVFTSWKAEWRKAVFINNAYSHTTSYPFFYFSLAENAVNGNFQLTSINENYYTANTAAPIVKVKAIHGQYNCTDINSIQSLQSSLRSISGSSNISIVNPIQVNPQFVTTGLGGFQLLPSSGLVEAGSKIPGFYDIKGYKPDIGAKESDYLKSIKASKQLSQGIEVYPNPAYTSCTVIVPNTGQQANITLLNLQGQVVFTLGNVKGQHIELNIENLPTGIYCIAIELDGVKTIKKVSKISY